MLRGVFSRSIYVCTSEMAHWLQPKAFQGQAQTQPCYLHPRVHPPTSPCPTHFTHTERISQGI